MTRNLTLYLMQSRFPTLPITILLLALTIALFEFSNLDSAVQRLFYFYESQTWIIDRNEPVMYFLLYSGIKKLFVGFVLVSLFAIIFLRKQVWVKDNLRGLIIVLLSCIVIPISVGALKDSTNMPCPKQIVEFGGEYNKIGLFEKIDQSDQQVQFRCYPAGHASGGFALLSLLFLFKGRKAKKIVLSSVLILGWSIATYKMLIGDHFLSHTIVTMLLSWAIILIIVRLVSYIKDRKLLKDL